MLLFIPDGADSPVRRMPVVNYGLIALNVLIFVTMSTLGPERLAEVREPLMLWPAEPTLTQFFTYQFLHGDAAHLAGNMLFLWVFGNSVNSMMGHIPYALFYLACGVLSGIGFVMTGEHNPCLGASGAIAGITTAYLVLFPRTDIRVFYWLWFYIGTTAINSMWLIIGKMILWDNFIAMHLQRPGMTNVAYSAHLAGYFVGFVMMMALLALGALPRSQYDLLALWKRAYRRRIFASVMADPDAQAQATYGRVARPVSELAGAAPRARPIDPAYPIREAIAVALSSNDFDAATDKYEELIGLSPDHVLPQPHQIMIANHLMARQRHPLAAEAYEKYVRNYPTAPDAEQVRLLLGIIYARYLQQTEAARRCFSECAQRLTDLQLRRQAEQWLSTLDEKPGSPPAIQPSG
jgi:membrane associated rhomboid family serine protease